MDSSAYPNNQQFTASIFAPHQESSPGTVEQAPAAGNYYITQNVQQLNHHYGPTGAVVTTNNSENNSTAGQAGFGSANYYTVESGNSQHIGTYDPTAAGGSLAVNSSNFDNQIALPSQVGSIQYQQRPPVPPIDSQNQLQYYQPAPVAATIQDPYFFPAISYPVEFQQQDQFHQMYLNYNQSAAEPAEAAGREMLQQPATSQARHTMPAEPLAAPATSSGHLQTMVASTSGCCSSSSRLAKLEPGEAPLQQSPSSGAAKRTAESTALLLDSTSSSLSSNERKIKQKANSSQSAKHKQQPEHLVVSSCHTNRVRAGPLGIIARRKNATRETTAILKEWLDEHGHNPYPSKGEKIMLSCVTKMSMTQVSTWFANARRRMKKERRFHWVTTTSGGGGGGVAGKQTSGGASSSLTKVKSEYAKVVMASSTGCPALKYFMQKHHKQMLAEHAPAHPEQTLPAPLQAIPAKVDPQAQPMVAAYSGEKIPTAPVVRSEPTTSRPRLSEDPVGHAHLPASGPEPATDRELVGMGREMVVGGSEIGRQESPSSSSGSRSSCPTSASSSRPASSFSSPFQVDPRDS